MRKDGTVLWVRETARAVLLKNRPVVLVACEDITERKRAGDSLRRPSSACAPSSPTPPSSSSRWIARACLLSRRAEASTRLGLTGRGRGPVGFRRPS